MANYITIDGGTTNTRVNLVCDKAIVATKKLGVGSSSKDTEALKSAIQMAVATLLSENRLLEADIECILASGMITSEYGLCSLPHISLPANAEKLHNAMHKTVIGDVSPIPFCFIRGVKKDGSDLDGVDIMRGEETELMGILKPDMGACLYVLPGSHSKHISVDACGSMIDLRTMMTGELFAAVMQHTILRHAADLEHNRIDEASLLNGFAYAKKRGVNEALFKTRILSTVFGGTKEQCYSFLLGCVLCDEVDAILKAKEKTVVLGGQKQFRTALTLLLLQNSDKKIVTLTDAEVERSTSLGAIQIFEL